jgi:hypothetical protein
MYQRKYMLYKILFKYKYVCTYIRLHFIETFNTDYVRHFNYVRQTDRHNLNFDVGGIVIQLVGKDRFYGNTVWSFTKF